MVLARSTIGVLLAVQGAAQRLRITNGCKHEPLWVAHMATNTSGPDPENLKIEPLKFYDFETEKGLTGTRYWAKMRCDPHGNACDIGESGGPDEKCNLTLGCAPPVDTKFEASFGVSGVDWVDVSLVDGWTLPFTFEMDKKCSAGDGDRKVTKKIDCSKLSFDNCPTVENLHNDTKVSLQVRHPSTGAVVGCYSPCSKLTLNQWQNEAARGFGPADPSVAPYCCPTPPESPTACRKGPVATTEFVKAVHRDCPGVYGYSYDDGMGLLLCPADTKYVMTFFCPSSPPPTTTAATTATAATTTVAAATTAAATTAAVVATTPAAAGGDTQHGAETTLGPLPDDGGWVPPHCHNIYSVTCGPAYLLHVLLRKHAALGSPLHFAGGPQAANVGSIVGAAALIAVGTLLMVARRRSHQRDRAAVRRGDGHSPVRVVPEFGSLRRAPPDASQALLVGEADAA